MLADLVPLEREVRSRTRRWYVMRLRPYRTVEDRIDGTVVTLVDITERLRAERALGRSEQQLRALVRASSQALYRMNPDWSEMQELLGSGLMFSTDRPTDNWIESYIPADERERVRSAIRHAVDTNGAFDLEHRVNMRDGRVGWVQSRATAFYGDDGALLEWIGSANDITLRKRTEDALRDSEERMRVLIEGMPQIAWRADPDGGWSWSSPQWTAYTGLTSSQSRGGGWLAAVHPDDRERVRAGLRAETASGAIDVEMRVRQASTGAYRWFQTRALPVKDRHGEVIEWLGNSTDVDDLRELRERQAILVAELQHRTRNLIGMVRSMADAILRTSPGIEDFSAEFRDRLDALARVQMLLSRLGEGERLTFEELLRAELSAAGAPRDDPARVVLDGPPDVYLLSRTVQTFALALHELATNANKYGAFAQPGGRLRVTWRLQRAEGSDDPRLVVDWQESGVVMPPEGAMARGGGAGRVLIEQALPYELGATTSFVMASDGVRCSIALPISSRTPIEG